MSLPLNLIFDRTANGKLRAEVAGHRESAVEATNLSGLLDAVEEAFFQFLADESCEAERRERTSATGASVAQTDVDAASTDEDDKALCRAAIEGMPNRESLKKLVSGHQVPDHWPEGDEDWGVAP